MELIPREELGKRLYNARKKMNYTFRQASEVLGLPVQTLFNIEKGLHPRVSKGTWNIVSEFISFAENDYIAPTPFKSKRWLNDNEF